MLFLLLAALLILLLLILLLAALLVLLLLLLLLAFLLILLLLILLLAALLVLLLFLLLLLLLLPTLFGLGRLLLATLLLVLAALLLLTAALLGRSQNPLHHLQVVAGVRMVGLVLEGMLIGLHRLRKLALSHPGIAQVVEGVGGHAGAPGAGKRRLGLRVASGTVEGDALAVA